MKKLTFIDFENKALKTHNDKYSYIEEGYINAKTKSKIYCKRCEEYFYQVPSTHLLGKGHKNCSLRKTKEQFLEEAKYKYGDRFIYDMNDFSKSTDNIKITCTDCNNSYIQKAITHLLSKNGCPTCGRKQANDNIRKSFQSFLDKSIERNGDIFKFEIIDIPFSRKGKLKVHCKLCKNDFVSYANNILNKNGCPSCSHNSKHPDTQGFVYQLEYNGELIPYIGITTCTLNTRLRRHREAVVYSKSNTKLFRFLKGLDMDKLSMKELDKCKAFELAEREEFWINKLNTKFPNGLNVNKGGSGLNLKRIMNLQEVQEQINELISEQRELLSDGFHSFQELYNFRKAFNAALFNEWAKQGLYDTHKSWKHSDGNECFGGGWFIVVAQLPTGQISNHYPAKDWDDFKIPEVEKGKEWDGHTAQDVLERISKLYA